MTAARWALVGFLAGLALVAAAEAPVVALVPLLAAWVVVWDGWRRSAGRVVSERLAELAGHKQAGRDGFFGGAA